MDHNTHRTDSDPHVGRSMEIDPQVEKKLVRKIDFHLIPVIMILYMLAFLDRSNIGNAEASDLKAGPGSLGLTDPEAQWLIRIFYISYILFEPLALIWKVFPPHQVGACCVIGWGICATLQAAVWNWRGLMVLRFFLGVFEAAFSPGILLLLSLFYQRNELGLRCGLYLASGPLANSFSGALGFAITSIKHENISSWRLLFLVEGLPVILAAIFTWYLLPDSPETAKFLDSSEQALAAARISPQTEFASEKVVHGIQWQEIPKALFDYKLWMTSLMLFSCTVSTASLSVFLPKILKDWGYDGAAAQGLTAPPYLAAFVFVIITAVIADRTSQRGIVICVMSLVGAAGYIMLAMLSEGQENVRYGGIFLIAAGIFPAITNIMPWVLNNQATTTRKGVGVAFVQFIGHAGPLLGTTLYSTQEENVKGFWVCGFFMLVTAFLALMLRTALWLENRRMDGTNMNGFKYQL